MTLSLEPVDKAVDGLFAVEGCASFSAADGGDQPFVVRAFVEPFRFVVEAVVNNRLAAVEATEPGVRDV
ncbi:hypothetical protein [Verrucomicrobium sp. GAS474]|uniref:hypothetical protein n=1 Tax=Verrucomicrobium sp. GAS474 TaxID=1882831 RepID=UPI000B89AB4A|nr:hypothetical protein [Verrucomicrobium sp. GAS474]